MNYLNLDISLIINGLKQRDAKSHKGDFGRILMLCGSVGYTGAAYFAAMGGLRMGAGLVYLCVPRDIYAIEAAKLAEPIVLPLSSYYGKVSKRALSVLLDMIPKMDAILIGPGIGRSREVDAVVCKILQEYCGTIVLDADGIFALSSHKDILRNRTGTTILTPHEGEFQRFTGFQIKDRVADAARVALESNCILVLKGHGTVITDGYDVWINPTGNPGMAVGGSGDLLAGMITGLLGQGLSPFKAAAAGAYIHGMAGDICAEELGQCAMLPTDMLNVLPQIMK